MLRQTCHRGKVTGERKKEIKHALGAIERRPCPRPGAITAGCHSIFSINLLTAAEAASGRLNENYLSSAYIKERDGCSKNACIKCWERLLQDEVAGDETLPGA